MLDSAVILDSERVSLTSALARVLAENVTTDIDMPPFRKAAMDGFACRRQDLINQLSVIESIAAGTLPVHAIGPDQCARIMTGAPVPEGADCVVRIEDIAETGDGSIRFVATDTSDNICERGEDMRAGDVILSRGEWITPAHIAILAATGCTEPRVYRQPRVAVLATGSELVDAQEKAIGAMIRNSNGPQLCAQIKQSGAIAEDFGVIADTRAGIDAAVKEAEKGNDLVLLSGGVSVGDFDLVPEILKDNGFSLAFESVAMQPGRPMVFGRKAHTFCCGLPGNPVSTFVVFELLLKPFLQKLMGHEAKMVLVPSVAARDIRRGHRDRQVTIPVAFTPAGHVTPVEFHGSAHIGAMTRADALLSIVPGKIEIRAGETVHVRPI